MKSYTLIGIILILVAVVAFGYQGISYTSREKVIDFGSLQVTAEQTKTIPPPPARATAPTIGGSGIVLVCSAVICKGPKSITFSLLV